METLAQAYANYAAALTYDELPAQVLRKISLLLLDTVGVELGGAGCPAAEKLRQVLPGMNEGSSPVTGGGTAHPWTAAFINGTCAHYLDMDDGHKPSISHPAVAIFPALQALAALGGSGKTFLTAAVAGYEVMCRLGTAMQPDHQSRLGFHTTGTCGTIGSAVACARFLGLDAEKTCHAIGIASLQASGLLEVMSSGVMSKPFHAGKAAAGGLLAAQLAARGMEAPVTSLDGPKGLLNAMGGAWRAEETLRDLGVSYRTLDAYFKFHAACGLCHSAADALRGLKKDCGFSAADVAGIDLYVQSYAYDVVGSKKAVANGTAMKFSLPHAAALILLFDDLLPLRFTDANLRDPRVRELSERVLVHPSGEMDKTFPGLRSSLARVTLRDGRIVERRVDAARGHPENPPEDAEILDKFLTLSADQLDVGRARALADGILRPSGAASAADLFAALYNVEQS